MKSCTEVVISPYWQRNGFSFHLLSRMPDGNLLRVGRPVEMTPVQEAGSLADPEPPTFFLNLLDAQGLADALYQAGIRPSECKPVSDILAGAKTHIDDLRTITLRLLDHVTVKPAS